MRLHQIGPIVSEPDGLAWLMAAHLIRYLQTYSTPQELAQALGLPKSLTFSLLETLDSILDSNNSTTKWTNFLWLCIIITQGRFADMTPEEIAGRVELESIIEQELFGEWLSVEDWQEIRDQDTRTNYHVFGLHSSTSPR